jgi:DNA phosphorothioation-dependent restriction protein DptG
MVKTKRIYDPVSPEDGKRILIDRLWPRGINKEEARIDEWLRDIAPSAELRKWFSHDPEKWQEFKKRYKEELKDKPELVRTLKAKAKKGTITLLFASKDTEHVNAAVLKEVLDKLPVTKPKIKLHIGNKTEV